MRTALVVTIVALLLLSLTAIGWAQVVKVNEPEVCFNCHSDLNTSLEKKYVHTAFKTGKCSSCHNPHASRHAKLLADDAGVLCLSCHTKSRRQ